MSKYYGTLSGVKRDELQGGLATPMYLRNVEVGSDAVITRGTVLAADTTDGIYSAATASDTNKVLVIAREDFVAESESRITQAYTSGSFNRERLKFATSDTSVTEFEEPLRKANIILTGIQDLNE